jgi:hypothetical protein
MSTTRRITLVGVVCLAAHAVPVSPDVHACTCLVDANPAKQRAQNLERAALVFEGKVIRQRRLQEAQWTCDFDSLDQAVHRDSCLHVRAVAETCEGWKGVNIILKDAAGVLRRSAYTDDSGAVALCGVASGKYRVEAKATRLEAEPRTLDVGSGTQTILLSMHPPARRQFVATLLVEALVKGEKVREVEIRTWENDGSCGFGPFAAGCRYEVFATSGYRWPPESAASFTGPAPAKAPTGSYVVDLCSGTRLLPDYPPKGAAQPGVAPDGASPRR